MQDSKGILRISLAQQTTVQKTKKRKNDKFRDFIWMLGKVESEKMEKKKKCVIKGNREIERGQIKSLVIYPLKNSSDASYN